MYRTTAEIVAGSKVFAGGKWLKCIGNKRVSVGERIWTDGRCVYGHFQEAQQPLVITGGDEAIPIAMYDSDDDKIHFYIFKRRLFEIDESPVENVSRDIFYIDDEPRTNFIHNAIMINDTKRNIYFQYGKIPDLIATNVDNKGNIYTLQKNFVNHQSLVVCKNNELLFDIDSSIVDLRSSAKEKANSLVGGGTLDTSADAKSAIYTGFVENENNWAVLIQIHGSAFKWLPPANSITYKYYKVDFGIKRILDGTESSVTYTTSSIDRFYLVTSQKKELLHECICQFYCDSGIEADSINGKIQVPGSRSCSINRISSSDIKISLPDGYYYAINSYPNLSVLGDSAFAPLYMEITIFAPNGGEILTDTFHVNSYITITQITTKTFLIGVKIRNLGEFSNVVNEDFNLSITNKLSIYLRNSLEDIKSFEIIGGTFWVTNGRWVQSDDGTSFFDVEERFGEDISLDYLHNTPFVGNGLYLYSSENGLEKIATGVCMNQRLRPMPRGKIKSDNFTFTDLI